MKLYSDKLTDANLRDALPRGVYIETVRIKSPRKRANGWTVALSTDHGSRMANSGQYGATQNRIGDYAATWDEWGIWMAALFAIDPDATMTYYKDRADFYRQTSKAAAYVRKAYKPTHHYARTHSAPWLKGATTVYDNGGGIERYTVVLHETRGCLVVSELNGYCYHIEEGQFTEGDHLGTVIQIADMTPAAISAVAAELRSIAAHRVQVAA